MTSTERADGYLTIPTASAEELDGVRWSHRCDALELADGTTLALAGEVQLILEGVFSRPRVPPFAFILNLLLMLKRDGTAPEVVRLRRAWATGDRFVWAHARRELFGERRRPELASVPPLTRAGSGSSWPVAMASCTG